MRQSVGFAAIIGVLSGLEAATFLEVLQKTTELRPDVIVLDLHMPGCGFSAQLRNDHKLLAISFACDDESKELA